MPIFKVTVREEVRRDTVAFVDAKDEKAADEWAAKAADHLFAQEGEEDVWAQIDRIDPVDGAPDGRTIHSAEV